jgi:hypothetical protein
LVHISSREKELTAPGKAVITYCEGGDFAKVKFHSEPRAVTGGGGRKKAINRFTNKSRLGLLRRLAMIDRSSEPPVWFVTMTARRDDSVSRSKSWKAFKTALDRWAVRVTRVYGKQVGMLWKVEPHKSGFPHVHVLMFWWDGEPDLAEFRKFNDALWPHLCSLRGMYADPRVCCQVQPMDGWKGVAGYCSKYLGKACQMDGETGRFWGFKNRPSFKFKIGAHVVDGDVAEKVLRQICKLKKRRGRRLVARYTDHQRKHGAITADKARKIWWHTEGQKSYPDATCYTKAIGPWGEAALHWLTRHGEVSNMKLSYRTRRTHHNRTEVEWNLDCDSGKMEPGRVYQWAHASGFMVGISPGMLARLVKWAESEVADHRRFNRESPI